MFDESTKDLLAVGGNESFSLFIEMIYVERKGINRLQ